MWVNNKGNGWFTKCKGKDKDMKESCYFLNIQFTKGNEPQGDSANIEVSKWFMSSYFKKDGTPAPKLVIQEYKIASENIGQFMAHSQLDDHKKVEDEYKSNFGAECVIDPEDIPFY